MQKQEKVDPGINEHLAKMINQLMFKKDKPDGKPKEKLRHIIRPANCDSLVTTKVNELIWHMLGLKPGLLTLGLRLLRLELSSQSKFYQNAT